MNDRAALERAVAANPYDDTVRLALADFCDETDDPERAEFIRLQMEAERLPGCTGLSHSCTECHFYGTLLACSGCQARYVNETRVSELLRRNWRAWLALPEMDNLQVADNAVSHGDTVSLQVPRGRGQVVTSVSFFSIVQLKFVRGFAAHLRAPLEYLSARLDDLLDRFPITNVRIELSHAAIMYRANPSDGFSDFRLHGLDDRWDPLPGHPLDVTERLRMKLHRRWPRVRPEGWHVTLTDRHPTDVLAFHVTESLGATFGHTTGIARLDFS